MTEKSPGRRKADLKVVILGDAFVGKTCLIRRYMDGIFYNGIPNTVGAAFFLKQYGASNVAIWDTAGEEKFSGLSSFYCRQASAAIVAYDIGCEETFLSIDNRYLRLLEAAGDNCAIVLVGTKLDLINNRHPREVSQDQAIAKVKQLSIQWNSKCHPDGIVPFFETSSKTGDGVIDVFNYIFETITPEQKIKENIISPHIRSQNPTEKQSKCC